MTKKVLLVFGTRPEAIKMAPLVKALEKAPSMEMKVCITAQHRQMLDQVLEIFEIVPDFDLDLMKNGQDLYDITSGVLLGMKEVLEAFAPDMVLVHGDTTTTFGASLAAFYQQIEVGHVEAGLRTGDIYSPWPEEANRKLTTQITTCHFAPTKTSMENLLQENVPASTVTVTGNTVIDALYLALEKIESNSILKARIVASIEKRIADPLFLLEETRFILVTGHRRENHGEGFIRICRALRRIAEANPQVHIVYPVHLNPNVQQPVNALLKEIDNVHLIDPLQYEEFVYIMKQSYFIITDSGGVQEEAPSLGKPVLVMRETTERPEAVEAGTVKLVGTEEETIVVQAQKLLDDHEVYDKMNKAHNPYGDGKASERIVDRLLAHFHLLQK